jgi:hypothetical protein
MGRGNRSEILLAVSSNAGSQSARPAHKSLMRMINLEARTSQYKGLSRDFMEGELDDTPSYQREYVWSEERQRNLIKSLTMGLPTGSIYINQRDLMKPRVVVDGKQRLNAVVRFFSGELMVPSEWFSAEQIRTGFNGEDLSFHDLTEATQRLWSNSATTNVYLSYFEGEDAEEKEKELFELINYGGVPQGASDLT